MMPGASALAWPRTISNARWRQNPKSKLQQQQCTYTCTYTRSWKPLTTLWEVITAFKAEVSTLKHSTSQKLTGQKKKTLNLTGYKLHLRYDFKLRCVFFLLGFFVPFQVTLSFFPVKQRLVEIGWWRLFSTQTETGGGILIVHYLLLCLWTDEMKKKTKQNRIWLRCGGFSRGSACYAFSKTWNRGVMRWGDGTQQAK